MKSVSELRALSVVVHGLENPWATSQGACFGFASFGDLIWPDCNGRRLTQGEQESSPNEQRPKTKNLALSQLQDSLENVVGVLSIAPRIRRRALALNTRDLYRKANLPFELFQRTRWCSMDEVKFPYAKYSIQTIEGSLHDTYLTLICSSGGHLRRRHIWWKSHHLA